MRFRAAIGDALASSSLPPPAADVVKGHVDGGGCGVLDSIGPSWTLLAGEEPPHLARLIRDRCEARVADPHLSAPLPSLALTLFFVVVRPRRDLDSRPPRL